MNTIGTTDRPRLISLLDELVSSEDGSSSVVQDWSQDKTRRIVAAMVDAGISVPAADVSAVLRSPGIVDTIQAAMFRREFAVRTARVSGSFAVA